MAHRGSLFRMRSALQSSGHWVLTPRLQPCARAPGAWAAAVMTVPLARQYPNDHRLRLRCSSGMASGTVR